jgi:hypothetical protein
VARKGRRADVTGFAGCSVRLISGLRIDAPAFAMVQDFMRRVTSYRAFAIAAALGFSSNAIAESIQLSMPIACEPGRTCYIQNYTDVDPSGAARDYKCGTLTYDRHNGTDFRLPSLASQKAGVEVLEETMVTGWEQGERSPAGTGPTRTPPR